MVFLDFLSSVLCSDSHSRWMLSDFFPHRSLIGLFSVTRLFQRVLIWFCPELWSSFPAGVSVAVLHSSVQVVVLQGHSNGLLCFCFCLSLIRQRGRKVLSEGDGADDDQEKRLSQQQTSKLCLLFSVCQTSLQPKPFSLVKGKQKVLKNTL